MTASNSASNEWITLATVLAAFAIALSSCGSEAPEEPFSLEIDGDLVAESSAPKSEATVSSSEKGGPEGSNETEASKETPDKATDPRLPSKTTPNTGANASDVADLASAPGAAPDPKAGAVVKDIWKPASTPKGGVSWSTLESTGETTRLDSEGYIVSKPKFSAAVKRLEGKRIKVAGWMMPVDNAAKQKRFILLGYPPGCPYHFHAAPMQFIEVLADTPFPTNETKVHVVSGVLELTGYDESGIFYRLRKAKPS